MAHVNEAIEQAESDLAHTREALREAREMVASLEQDLKSLELELVGLRSFARRNGLSPAVESAPPALRSIGAGGGGGAVVPISAEVELLAAAAGPDLLLMSRNEAVATVLSHSGVPLDRTSIHEQCAMSGRDDSLDEISLSLSGLKRAGKVQKLGRGLWQLADTGT